MAKPTRFVQALQTETGWKSCGRSVIGKHDGFWFVVTQPGMGQPIIVASSVSEPDASALGAVAQDLKARKKLLRLGRITYEGNILTMAFNPALSIENNKVRTIGLVSTVARLMAQRGMSSGCAQCGTTEALAAFRVGEAPATVCPACQEELQSNFAATRDRNALTGNYLTGLVGAILGSLIGASVWLLVSYLGYYASITGLVMAFLAERGYRLFKGKVGRGMPIAILFALIIGIFAANILEIAIALSQDPDVGMTFLESLAVAPRAFYDTENFYVDKVWISAGVGLLFALMGSWRILGRLAGEAKGETLRIEPV